MAALPHSPMYEDETTVAVNWWLIRGAVVGWGTTVVLAVSLAVVATQRPAPYVFPVNNLGQPVGMLYPVTSTQAIPDPILRRLRLSPGVLESSMVMVEPPLRQREQLK